MKKFKMIAAVAVAAAIGTATLAACSGGKKLGVGKFDISDYAHSMTSVYAKNHLNDYSETSYVNDAYTTVTQKGYTQISYLNGNFANAYNGETYAFYDVENDVELYNNLYASVGLRSYNGYYYSFNYYTLVRKNPDGASSAYSVQYAGPDGKLLTYVAFDTDYYNYANDINFNYEKTYTNDDGDRIEYVRMYYFDGNGSVVERYFSLSKNDEGEIVFEGVTEEEMDGNENNSEYKAGSQLGLIKNDLDVAKDYPVDSYKNIKYSVEGGLTETYTYYQGDTKLSSVSITNGQIVAYVGDYVYFYEMEYVSVDAEKGYNLEVNAGNGTVVKTNVNLYRYNFMKGNGLKEIAMKDYVIIGGQAIYNYSKGEFDAFVAAGYKMVNGVAVASAKPYALVLNNNGKVIADLSGTALYDMDDLAVYKLRDNRYLAGSCIIDGDCSIVAQLPGNSSVWADKGLIKCGNNMLVDYDGKVVIEPADGTLYFYGDVAYTSNNTLYSKANPSGVELKDVISVNEAAGETAYITNGAIIKRTTVAGDSSTTYTYHIYNLSGTEIGTISNVVQSSINFSKIGSKLVASNVAVMTSETTNYVSYIIG